MSEENNNINERNYTEQLRCSKSTKKLLMENCIAELIIHHPELKGMNITQNMILRNVIDYYLKN